MTFIDLQLKTKILNRISRTILYIKSTSNYDLNLFVTPLYLLRDFKEYNEPQLTSMFPSYTIESIHQMLDHLIHLEESQ
jgi:predicted SPOUT superfamily RNA methylase MTH1